MFDSASVKEYRAVKAPDALKARLAPSAKAPASKPRLAMLWPIAAAVAACLVLVIYGTMSFKVPNVTVCAKPLTQTARAAYALAPSVSEIVLTADGTITLEAADESIRLTDDQPLTFPYKAQNQLTLVWSIDPAFPDATLTVNGQTHTLHADMLTGDVTVL